MSKHHATHRRNAKKKPYTPAKHWLVNQGLLDDARYRSLVRSMLLVFNCMLIGYFLLLPPSPTSTIPATAHGVEEPIRVQFTKPILKDGFTPTIQPAVDGTWQFEEPILGSTLYRSAVFTPTTTLLPEQTYSVLLDQITSLTSVFPATATLQLHTAPYPIITSASVESESELSDRCAPITLSLDQPIITAGAFTVTTAPEQPLDISLAEDGRSYTVVATNCFREGEHYVLTAEPSLDDTRDTSAFSVAFHTAPVPEPVVTETPAPKPKAPAKPKVVPVPEPITELAIANDRQDYPLSCEVAAIKMALNYKGAGVSEETLLDLLGVSDPYDRDGDLWGDPNAAFVGNVSGSQNSTGYGVHWGPIARVASQFASVEAFSGWSPSDLAREIENGNPVEIWGTTGRARQDSWHTPDGTQISAWVGEHTRLVIGFAGSADNPTRFIINDPAGGRLLWTTAQLRSNWGTFGNSGVVVR